ncbi:hypothetical protein NQ318_003947 [Aromia moschata]|uniref:TGF-beta family profile domain-containing protein n=1 Tax=Aromia moschata TaxID=1265417 RepID=A0AAV8ZAN6_9CUCU|nr:hypothetical protein NQ318_003947 [Aromia moschata]
MRHSHEAEAIDDTAKGIGDKGRSRTSRSSIFKEVRLIFAEIGVAKVPGSRAQICELKSSNCQLQIDTSTASIGSHISMTVKLVAVIIIFNAVVRHECKKVNVYIDNGRDQTTLNDLSTRTETAGLEKEILKLLGITRRPRIISDPVKRSAHKHLLGVYELKAKRSAAMTNNVDDSDTIMAFDVTDVSGLKDATGKFLWFKSNPVSTLYDAIGAELRIYKTARPGSTQEFTIGSYEVRKRHGKATLHRLSSTRARADFEGWLSLNLTSFYNRRAIYNNKIYLAVDSFERAVNLDEMGVSYQPEDARSPFVVAYAKTENRLSPVIIDKSRNRVKKSFGDVVDLYNAGRACQLRTLHVSFADLRWRDWIVAPEGYTTHYCEGECGFPLRMATNATNHAIMQSLMHLMHSRRFPRPCCAPAEYAALQVLYRLDDYSVVLRKYPRMIAESCGCH